MKKSFGYSHSIEFKRNIKQYFMTNKGYIWLMLFVIIVAFVTGIFTGIKSSGDISISNCNDKALVALFEDDISIFSFFVKRVFGCICVLLVMLLLCRFKAIIPVSIIFVAYFAFSLGLNFIVISMVFGFGGVINVVVVILPIQLVVLGVYVFGAICAIKDCLVIATYGRLVCNGNPFVKWLVLFAILLLLCIVESLLINLTRASFIFII